MGPGGPFQALHYSPGAFKKEKLRLKLVVLHSGQDHGATDSNAFCTGKVSYYAASSVTVV